MIGPLCRSLSHSPHFASVQHFSRLGSRIIPPYLYHRISCSHKAPTLNNRVSFPFLRQEKAHFSTLPSYESTLGQELFGHMSLREINGVALLNPQMSSVFEDFFGNAHYQDMLGRFLNLKGEDQVAVEGVLRSRDQCVQIGRPAGLLNLSVKTKRGESYLIELQTYNHSGQELPLPLPLGEKLCSCRRNKLF